MSTNHRKIIFPFLSAKTAISNGDELSVGTGMVLMNIAVTGDAGIFTLVFEGKANDTDVYSPIMCANLATLALVSSVTVNGKYQMSLEGLTKVRTRLSAIGSGACSSVGTVVD